MPDDRTIGERAAALAGCVNQAHLADRLGLNRSALCYWEKQGRIPESRVRQIAAEFGCSPARLRALAKDPQDEKRRSGRKQHTRVRPRKPKQPSASA